MSPESNPAVSPLPRFSRDPMPASVCVMWPRLGPYHLARLRAAHARFADEGAEVVALETAGDDATYEWDPETGDEPFRRVQMFPGATYDALAPADLHARTHATLDALDPEAVAINAYSTPDALAALAWCRSRRRTAVLFMESTARDAPRTGLREWVKRHLVSQYDAALAGGTAQRDYLLQLGFPEDHIFLGYDVVDNDFFREGAANAPRESDLPGLTGGPFFLTSNRFVARKNLARLLRAYAAYRARTDDPWRLVLLGDGSLRADLEAQAQPIAGVTFAGFRQIAELPTYYGHAGAFVHVPLVEQWGLVINEAMAAGLPVVASTHAGATVDLVREGENGLRVDPTDERAITEALLAVSRASESERRAMGKRSHEIIARHSPEEFAEGLWQAVRAGTPRSGRPASAIARAILTALRLGARRTQSFHAITE